MPGYKIGSAIAVGYAAFSKQGGINVASAAIESLTEEISRAGLNATKTGVTFSPKKTIPGDLIEKLAIESRREYGV
ncbi:hypothetical protein OPS25_09445 [Alteromonas ponticola]|uniref:Uncharacterized protein n=1 Tax=Alteromonas aquimaris TaxID=2998417 RepID=A0ABT3P836_9ALTE|nr:hypothetical protein [Alteromonas aquimaris]MCW8108720.1 hypothetical protein [Alteromonas aquimaris]